MTRDATHARYVEGAVVDFYARHADLQEAERRLFAAYLRPGQEVLDVGVGGGRTTPHLAAQARRYVGVDYSEPMVAHCRRAYPELSFELADATRMPLFADASFDLVVFSFNGLDSIPTLEGRRSCLSECARVLRPGGVFILSVHNARYLIFPPVLAGAGPLKRLWRLVYAAWRSLQLTAVRLPSRAFWSGAGYARDPSTHGGLRSFTATPARQTRELHDAGFDVERVLPAPSPDVRAAVAVAWYYYACRKRGRPADSGA